MLNDEYTKEDNINTESDVENNMENVQNSELKSMISNAIRYHKNINHDIKEHTLYRLSLKFMIDNKSTVMIDNINITEKFDETIIPEPSMQEKYDEYEYLMKDMNKNVRSKVKNRFKDVQRSVLKMTNSKVPM